MYTCVHPKNELACHRTLLWSKTLHHPVYQLQDGWINYGLSSLCNARQQTTNHNSSNELFKPNAELKYIRLKENATTHLFLKFKDRLVYIVDKVMLSGEGGPLSMYMGLMIRGAQWGRERDEARKEQPGCSACLEVCSQVWALTLELCSLCANSSKSHLALIQLSESTYFNTKFMLNIWSC